MTQTKIQQFNPQIFSVWSDRVINSRLDCFYWMPNIYTKRLATSKFEVKKIRDIIESIKSGTTPKQNENPFGESHYYFIRNTDLQDGYITLEKAKTIRAEIYDRYLALNLRKGDVLVCIAGTIGVSGVFDLDVKAIFNQNVSRLRFKNNVLPEYANLWFNSNAFLSLINQNATQATIKYVNNDILGNLLIPLPPLSIQNKIVDIMEKAYKQRNGNKAKARKLLDSIDDYVLSDLGIKMPEIKKKMVFEVWSDKVEDRMDAEYWQPFLKKVEREISTGKYKIQKLKNFITEIHYGASVANAYVESGIPFLRILNLKPNNFNLSNVVNLPENFRKKLGKAFVKTDDLLISRSGTVGIVSVVPKEADGFAFGSFMIKFCLNEKINKKFASIWLNNKFNKLLTEREKIGAIQGNITISTIENFNIPNSPISIQNKIVKKVDSIYSRARALEEQSEKVLSEAKGKVEKIILS
jgi:restriction endonuclease S subunit